MPSRAVASGSSGLARLSVAVLATLGALDSTACNRPEATVPPRTVTAPPAEVGPPSDPACAWQPMKPPAGDLCEHYAARAAQQDPDADYECSVPYVELGEYGDGQTLGVFELEDVAAATVVVLVWKTPETWYTSVVGSAVHPGVGVADATLSIGETRRFEGAEGFVAVINASYYNEVPDDGTHEEGRQVWEAAAISRGGVPTWVGAVRTHNAFDIDWTQEGGEHPSDVTNVPHHDDEDAVVVWGADQVEVRPGRRSTPSAAVGTFGLGELRPACVPAGELHGEID